MPTILTKESDPASHSDDIGHPKCKQEPLNDFNKLCVFFGQRIRLGPNSAVVRKRDEVSFMSDYKKSNVPTSTFERITIRPTGGRVLIN